MRSRTKIYDRLPRLNSFIEEHGRAPTLSELCTLFHVHSKNTASVMAAKFVELGALRRSPSGRLVAPYPKTQHRLKLLGAVAAGFPSPAEESLLDTMTLDEYLVEHPEATFMLQVEGDSMIEAGILPGDTILVERGRTPRNGDIVIACVDGAWTMKFFYRDAQGVRLEPANTNYSTIRPQRTLSVEGVVASVIRKLL
ncbi:MAG: repressor LexA [Lentisphaerae bacterium]|jgi:repressor LexA|nr:repressor LexA [Lentisphaerota bacterium]